MYVAFVVDVFSRRIVGAQAARTTRTSLVLDALNMAALTRRGVDGVIKIAQKIALLWQSPCCSVEGCTRTRIEFDHREPWARTKHTRLGELDCLCAFHHDLKHRDGWGLVGGTGNRAMVPPDHPDHPENHPKNRPKDDTS